MRSSVATRVCSSIARHRASVSITSRTKVSGAEAPAGEAERFDPFEPGRVDIAAALDQPGRRAAAFGDLDQPHRVRAVGRADHEHQLAFGGDRLHRRLAVRGRIADVFRLGPRPAAEKRARNAATISAVSSTERVVWVRNASGASSAKGSAATSSIVSTRVIVPFGHLAESADHFGMAAVADEHDVPPRPASWRSAWRWTLLTSGQVASSQSRPALGCLGRHRPWARRAR